MGYMDLTTPSNAEPSDAEPSDAEPSDAEPSDALTNYRIILPCNPYTGDGFVYVFLNAS